MPPLNRFNKNCLTLAISQALLAPSTNAAIINVNNNGDNGAGCTLREAVETINAGQDQANGCVANGNLGINDTIAFNLPSISGIDDQIVIENDVMINPGGQTVTINGTGNSRIFSIFASTVTMDNLVITGGDAGLDDGGAIYIEESSVTLTNSTLSENTAEYGGAIFANPAVITLDNSTVTENSAGIEGGGIFLENTAITLTDANVSENTATESGGGIRATDSTVGGGIRASVTSVILGNSTLTGNSAGDEGGGMRVFQSTVTLTNSTLTGNSASDNGGGMRVFQSTVTLTDSTVSDNIADEEGGGMRVTDSTLTLTDSTVSGNSAGDDGGGVRSYNAIVALTNSIVSDNTAGNDGGGIHTNEESSVTVTNSTLSDNSAGADGGAIYLTGLDTSVTLDSSTLSGNSATNFGGGVVATFNSGLFVRNSTVSSNITNVGGGIFVSDLSTAELLSNTVSGNSALVRGGGLYSDTTSFQIINTIVSGNNAPGIGKEIYNVNGFTSLGYNLLGHDLVVDIQAFSGFSPVDTDITATFNGTDPTALSLIVEPLDHNGGPTQTHALVESSPAINAGNQVFCTFVLNKDQRGINRNDGQCDIGSFEVVEEETCFVVTAQNGNGIVFCL